MFGGKASIAYARVFSNEEDIKPFHFTLAHPELDTSEVPMCSKCYGENTQPRNGIQGHSALPLVLFLRLYFAL